VGQARHCLRLAFEPSHALGGRRRDELDRDFAAQPCVRREIDHTAATATEHAHDREVIGDASVRGEHGLGGRRATGQPEPTHECSDIGIDVAEVVGRRRDRTRVRIVHRPRIIPPGRCSAIIAPSPIQTVGAGGTS
jgi:hypothetical protein